MTEIATMISEYQELLKAYQKSKVGDLNTDTQDAFKKCRESFKKFTDAIVNDCKVKFGSISYGKWQYGFGISSYLWNRFSAANQSKSTLLLATVLKKEGLICTVDFNRKEMIQFERVIESKINDFINTQVNAIGSKLKKHFNIIKNNKILGFKLIEYEDIPSSNFSLLLDDLSTICDECVEKFYGNQNEIDFCEWFITDEGLNFKTLKIYHDALTRIFPELVRTNKNFEKIQFNKKSIFAIQSTQVIDSLINGTKTNGIDNNLTKDSYKHLLQALNKYNKFLNIEVSKPSDDKNKTTDNSMKTPLNQILFGPPGTGKTYNTVRKAVEIIDPEFAQKNDWNKIKVKYDELMKHGQIVFTTFHQSMAYEDFVEGLKPLSDNDQVTYEVSAGIFKQLCTKASSKETNNFSEAFKSLTDSINETDDELFELKTKTGKSFWVGVNSNGNLVLYTTEKKNRQGVFTLEKLNNHSINGDAFRGWEGYANAIIDELKSNHGLISSKVDSKTNKYVLIIDEINRGNVSAIFGELITLIEESKRAGNAEALEITLPYSKKKLSVPNNLYIIGTMNTADRSVEALDSALRRRFSFTEMPPKPKLIEQPEGLKENLIDILTTINKRIEVLLDKDHLIGHSYFMKVKNLADLKKAFNDEIIPLLQEYFFGDYGKISMVLGEGFCVGKKTTNHTELFAETNNDYEQPDYSDKLIYDFPSLDDDKDFTGALNLLLKNPIENK